MSKVPMIACCIPMLLAAIALVVTGVANAGTIFFALVCFVMMAVMMAGMGHGSGKQMTTRRSQSPRFAGLRDSVKRLVTRKGRVLP